MKRDYDREAHLIFRISGCIKKKATEISENKHIFWRKLNKKKKKINQTTQGRGMIWSLCQKKNKSKTPEMFLACDGISRTYPYVRVYK